MKKGLMISIIVFLIVLGVAIFLVLNKGHIGSYSMVDIGQVSSSNGDNQEEVIMPKLTLEIDKDYLSSKDKIILLNIVMKKMGLKKLY